jgi:hypothetical protein
MGEIFEPGELFVYTSGDRWELGTVRSKARDDAYFCLYGTGDTAACTPARCMHKLANAGWTRIEGEIRELAAKNDEYMDINGRQGSMLLEMGRRVSALESLARDLWECSLHLSCRECAHYNAGNGCASNFPGRMKALGLFDGSPARGPEPQACEEGSR